MTDQVISNIEQVNAEWLTSVLLKNGALASGAVSTFEADAGSGNWSSNSRLTLKYAEGSQGDLPQRLFLKMVNTNLGDESFGPSEVTYYTRDYLGVKDAPLVRCYHAAYSEKEQRYHLLLDDLSETHIEAVDRAPTLEFGYALADALAVMHAHWWGAERLAEAGEPVHSASQIQRFVDIAEPGVDHILQRFAGDLKPHWPEMIRNLFQRHPAAIIARTQDDNGFTLIHGDTGPYNILVPRHSDRPIYLIDRQPFDWSLTSWLGVYDLAYATMHEWDIEMRRRLEMPILRRYHQRLSQFGVGGYSWNRLWDDYRLCTAMGVYIAVEFCRGGVNEPLIWLWLSMLQRSLTAMDDLDCEELW